MEFGTTGPRSGQWVLHGLYQPCRRREALEPGAVLRQLLFCRSRGQIFAQASDSKDELLIARFDLDKIEEVRNVWQFFRDRRPETYGKLTEL
jgi:hypothetical protein